MTRNIALILGGIALVGLGIARYLIGVYGPPNHIMGIIFIAGGSAVIGLYAGRVIKDPMPQGPQGQKRKAGVIGNAVQGSASRD